MKNIEEKEKYNITDNERLHIIRNIIKDELDIDSIGASNSLLANTIGHSVKQTENFMRNANINSKYSELIKKLNLPKNFFEKKVILNDDEYLDSHNKVFKALLDEQEIDSLISRINKINFPEKDNSNLKDMILNKQQLKEIADENKLFTIALLNTDIYINKDNKKVTMNVTIPNTCNYLVTNKGKELAEALYKNNIVKSESATINDFIFDSSQYGSLKVKTNPLRWCSGGVLPILDMGDKQYVQFFFRDRKPIGLNIPIGASENFNEFLDVDKLIYREFLEEFILFKEKPTKNQMVRQCQLKSPFNNENWRNEKFNEEFKSLKIKEDGFEYWHNEEEKIEFDIIRTKYQIKITYDGQNNHVTNCIFSINPTELGIEVIKLLKIPYTEDNYILDGEILGDGSLLKRPTLLIDLDFLKKYFKENNGLGEYNEENDTKTLSNIPEDAFKIYNLDTMSKNERTDDFAKWWMKQWGTLFLKMEDNKNIINQDSEHAREIRTFCPVTWKTLEIALRDKIL